MSVGDKYQIVAGIWLSIAVPVPKMVSQVVVGLACDRGFTSFL